MVGLRRSDIIRRFLFLAKSNIAVNVAAISSQHGVNIDWHFSVELADHGPELIIILDVCVSPMQAY